MSFDIVSYAMGAKSGGGGGGVTVEPLSVSENGVYNAPSGKAYSPVTVDVPNSYDASDEGKVVVDSTLVAQTARTVTENGTFDTTTNNSVTVDVPQLGPAWTEFISATATTSIVESLGVLSQNLQAGKLYSVVIDKNASDYIANQLVALSTYNNGGDVTSWPTAFMRWKSASQGYSAQNIVSAAYDSTIQVGDKFFICEV